MSKDNPTPEDLMLGVSKEGVAYIRKTMQQLDKNIELLKRRREDYQVAIKQCNDGIASETILKESLQNVLFTLTGSSK